MSMFVITDGLPTESRQTASAATAEFAPVVPASPLYESVKSCVEFVFALFLLVFAAPLILFAMILIKLTSPGPAIYTQTRIGKNGKPFTIYKLRTMAHECESLTGPQWCRPGDSRITTVGRWLRKTHIDELPQLWNVLRGEMSLIGPRPERPEFMASLEFAVARYRERLRIRPGLTGFAQVQLPPDSDLDSVRIKLAYDLHYIQQMGIFFDIAIYFGTIGKLLGLSESLIRTVCQFPRRDEMEIAYAKLTEPAGEQPA